MFKRTAQLVGQRKSMAGHLLVVVGSGLEQHGKSYMALELGHELCLLIFHL